MSPHLARIAAAYLERLAETGGPDDIGAVGPDGPYPPDIRQHVGPLVAGLHRAGLVCRAPAAQSSRGPRHGSAVWQWQAVSRAACRAAADEYRRLAEVSDDDNRPGPAQRLLF